MAPLQSPCSVCGTKTQWASHPRLSDWKPDPEYPSYFMPPDSRKTIIVKCIVGGGRVQTVGYLPAIINQQSQPQVLAPADPRFAQVNAYMEGITASQSLRTYFEVRGEQVMVQEG